jgi:polysaccharide export outer membrane protein
VVQRSTVTDKDTNLPRPVTDRLPVQPFSGPFQVRLDGTVTLGFWGNVPVAGLTMEQAAEAIRQQVVNNPVLADFKTKPESIIVILDVTAYNSKRYYVLFDGAGFGEQVVSFPITGSETVLDAIANVGGLSDVASKRNIWVARRTPHPGQPWQILPVDWVGISQHGITFTNYQILPGDRIYVKAQKLVTIERTMARILAPIERAFGITLLGASTVNQISGRGQGFNNP